MTKRVVVIGIGNTLMGDDGVGVRVAERLSARYPDAGLLFACEECAPDANLPVRIVYGHTAGMALMPAVLSAEVVVFVDAIDAGDEAGSVFKFDPDEAGLTGLRSSTSHGVGIPYLVTNARLKGHSPEFVIYAVQIGDIMCGPDTLSPQVADAVPHVEAMVAEEVERRLPAPPTL